MRLLVDTSVLIDHLRGVDAATARLTEAVNAGDELWSLTIVRTEILAGAGRGQDRATRKLLGAFKWQELSADIADRAGDLARRYRKANPQVDTVDYLVAAAATALKAELLTQTPKRFPMFSKLRSAY
ncbi:MAG TPA: PIN domain-containing protein [Kofleriaceae bacterium]|nr:PIN domain-containing protein [Kofleriaceae bacterium]